MSFTNCTSLPVTLGHAVSFLITPLISVRPLPTLLALQHILNTTLTVYLSASWDERNPLKGSGRRCLSLSAGCTPPRPIFAACIAAGIKWQEWMEALGGKEFDLFIDPGCVSVRMLEGGRQSRMYTVWADEVASPIVAQQQQHRRPGYTYTSASVSLYSRSESPVERPSSRSSSSSESSNESDSGYSATSSMTAVSSTCSLSEKTGDKNNMPAATGNVLSRRQRAMMRRMVVDSTKVTPTCYEGGRTTVLTGGTMLGAPKATRKADTNESWRRL